LLSMACWHQPNNHPVFLACANPLQCSSTDLLRIQSKLSAVESPPEAEICLRRANNNSILMQPFSGNSSYAWYNIMLEKACGFQLMQETVALGTSSEASEARPGAK
jgi:hypothetical protein